MAVIYFIKVTETIIVGIGIVGKGSVLVLTGMVQAILIQIIRGTLTEVAKEFYFPAIVEFIVITVMKAIGSHIGFTLSQESGNICQRQAICRSAVDTRRLRL